MRWTGAECVALLTGLVRTSALIGCTISASQLVIVCIGMTRLLAPRSAEVLAGWAGLRKASVNKAAG